MSFISYAQNFEDIILYRALKDVKNGFYIDAGACHPVEHSITYAFYKLGWSGINIEPVDYFHKLLDLNRPNDINLKLVLSSSTGNQEMNISQNTGLSTINNEYAEIHKKAGFDFEKEIIPCTTLDKICSEHNVKTVHFLKIDVEGSEEDVIKGFSFEEIRPWILVIESTVPSTEMDNSQIWENAVLDKKYKFVYFDGLNKFYIAEEHLELEKHFKLPPNIFDGVVTNSEFESKNKLHTVSKSLEKQEHEIEILKIENQNMIKRFEDEKNDIKHQNESLKEDVKVFNNEIKMYKKHNEELVNKEKLIFDQYTVINKLYSNSSSNNVLELQNEINRQNEEISKIYSTISWKITMPLRYFKKGIIFFLKLFTSKIDRKYLMLIKKLLIFPSIKNRIRGIITVNNKQETPDIDIQNANNLTKASEKIYFELKKKYE